MPTATIPSATLAPSLTLPPSEGLPDPTVNFPRVRIEIAFPSGPLVANPSWFDVSTDVRQIEIQRGRQHELSRFDAGTCRLRLNNTHRNYDPTNTSSSYAPNVLPMRQVRVTADYEGTLGIPLFRGFIPSWTPLIVGANNAEIELEAVDALAALAMLGLDGATFGFDASGQRFADVMSEINWPSSLLDYRITDIQHLVTDAEEVEESALEHLQGVEESEMGELFVDGAGKVVFHDRRWHIELSTAASTATWGDDITSELPYVDLTPSYDADRIHNHAVVWLPDWDEGEWEDSASQTKYLKRTVSLNTQLYLPSDADNLAMALVWRYKEPRLRFDSMEVHPTYTPQVGTALWLKTLQAELGQAHTIKHRPPGGGPVTTQGSFIANLNHLIGPGKRWRSIFGLESPDPVTSFWTLEHATLGRLDTGGVLAY